MDISFESSHIRKHCRLRLNDIKDYKSGLYTELMIEVNEDILKEIWEYRDQTEFAYLTKEDKKHMIYFDEITEKILKGIPKQNRKFVRQQLNKLDDNFSDYVGYWSEKYYRNGFVDGARVIMGCLDE